MIDEPGTEGGVHGTTLVGADKVAGQEGHSDSLTPSDHPVVTGEDQSPDAGKKVPDQADEPETFDRPYVEKLRRESARYREQAQQADAIGRRLHTELVRATNRLADATDLPFDETHLADPEALTTAIDELLARKPHLAARRPMGDIGQGATASASPVDLAALLRQRA